jgi:glycosyltransferase involved in cell wall biosynthesis
MRICQVIHGIHDSSAGPSYSVAGLAHALAAQGHDSEILSLGAPPVEWNGAARLRLHDEAFAHATGLAFGLIRECRRRALRGDVLHNHGVWRPTNLFPLAVARGSRARMVCSPRGAFSAWSMESKALMKRPFWALLQRPALERVHGFHATAEPEAADIRRLGFRQPIAVIPNGIEVPRLGRRARRNEVLFLGRIAREKGLDQLLPAWREVAGHHREWKLRIAGPLEGSYAAEIQALARRLGLGGRCEFLGELCGEDKAAALASARIFVLPSYTENFGVAVAEALAHAVPVITTTGTPWTSIEERRCGWRVAPNGAALAVALRKALSSSPEALEAMGEAGRAWIARDFGWDAIGELMACTYEWLLAGAKGAAPRCIER